MALFTVPVITFVTNKPAHGPSLHGAGAQSYLFVGCYSMCHECHVRVWNKDILKQPSYVGRDQGDKIVKIRRKIEYRNAGRDITGGH